MRREGGLGLLLPAESTLDLYQMTRDIVFEDFQLEVIIVSSRRISGDSRSVRPSYSDTWKLRSFLPR
jgi:hypothetical protein